MYKRTSVACVRFLVLLFTLMFMACGAPQATTSAPPQGVAASKFTATPAPVLTDLQGPDDLKAQFNQDSGVPRVILLVSPT